MVLSLLKEKFEFYFSFYFKLRKHKVLMVFA